MPLASASKRHHHFKNDITEGQFENLLQVVSRLALVLLGAVALVAVMMAAKVILVPVVLAIIIGLVLGPVADAVERRGVPPALSALVVVLLLIALFALSIALFAVPLSEWISRGPAIWLKVQTELLSWKEPLEALASLQDQIKAALGGGDTVEVTVADNSQVLDIALIAPAILADILIFLVSLYFYIATRDNIRISVLSICVTRRMRWRTAHVFREVESKVSRFMIAVTFLNVCVGIAMTLVTWWLGLPSPLLWGALAAVLNYIPYVGQAVMVAILLAVGLATQTGLGAIVAPAGFYMAINFVEGQLIFPNLVGRAVTLNPFLIFLSIIFWIWVWGPVGSLVAVPSLLILQSIITNVLPMKEVKPRKPVRRTGNMTERDVVLANAATAIKEQAEDEAEAVAAVEAAKHKEPDPVIADAAPVATKKRAPRKPRGSAVPAT